MNQTISVIVPVYNVEKYLPECLDSLCGQTYRDLEILVVDDGSTDHSGEICDRYAARDGRIRVIHQKNGGAANAKNTALRLASGAYLTFADSDDYVESDAYQFMLRELQNKQVDVIQCAHREVFRDRTVRKGPEQSEQTMQQSAFLELFTQDWTCGLLWDKLYRRSLFDGIFFEEGHRIDDEYFTYRGILNAETVLRCGKITYNYRMRRSGVMASPSSKEQIVRDRLEYLNKRRRTVIARFPKLQKSYDDHYANMLLILLRDPYATEQSISQTKRQIHAFLSERPQIGLRMRLHLLRAGLQSPGKILTGADCNSAQPDLTMYFD